MNRIYLDNNASTPLDPRVLHAVTQDLQESIGNSSSIHFFGQQVRNRLTKARNSVAEFFGVKPQEVIFTSGGTEGMNMTIRGLLMEDKKPHGQIITSNVEHASVYQILKFLEKQGYEVLYLPAGEWGAVKPEAVKQAICADTRLIVLMAANNETGVKTEIEEIAKIAHSSGIPFVVDGVSLLGKGPVNIPQGVSAMSFSGHKVHAPKGVGATVVKQSMKLTPLLLGAHQEYQRRAGTENISGIVGFAEAISILKEESAEAFQRMEHLRDQLEAQLIANLDRVIVNGKGSRIVNTSNLSFLGVDGETLLMSLDREGVAVSHGSACSSGALEPSRILLNMGIPLQQARSTLRFSLSRLTTEEEIDRCVEIVTRTVLRLRKP